MPRITIGFEYRVKGARSGWRMNHSLIFTKYPLITIKERLLLVVFRLIGCFGYAGR